jgi:hypothetical protein
MKPGWFPDWTDECVAIVAAGPSVKKEDVSKLKDRIHVIAINESYRLCNWADAMYSCDRDWWRLAKGAPDFPGLKITQEPQAAKEFPDLKCVTIRRYQNSIVHDMLFDTWGEIGGGGNSGFQCMNLTAQFGVTAIMLLGIDCTGDANKPHWHGRHPPPLNNPIVTNYDNWRRNIDGAAGKLKARGIDVVNCSPISTLTKYPKMTVEEGLERWKL